jgi:hypothetical protein
MGTALKDGEDSVNQGLHGNKEMVSPRGGVGGVNDGPDQSGQFLLDIIQEGEGPNTLVVDHWQYRCLRLLLPTAVLAAVLALLTTLLTTC